MKKILYEGLMEKISAYKFITDDTRRDMAGDIRAGFKPDRLLQRFIQGCFSQRERFLGLPGFSDDPEYRAILKYLIEAGASVNTDCWGNTALIVATAKNDTTAVKYLMENGVDEKNRNIALIYAERSGHEDSAEILRSYGRKSIYKKDRLP